MDDGRLGQSCFRVVVGKDLWLGIDGSRKLLFENRANPMVQLPAPAFEQGLVCCVLNQRVFERVGSIGWRAAGKDKLGVGEGH